MLPFCIVHIFSCLYKRTSFRHSCIMKVTSLNQVLLLLAMAATGCDAVHKPKPHDNFRIVLDNKSPRGPSIGFRNNAVMDFDAKAFAKKIQVEAREVVDRVWDETRKITDKVQSEAKDLINQLRHYNKVEIGLYTALALSLTVALKSTSHFLYFSECLEVSFSLDFSFCQHLFFPRGYQRPWI